MRTFMHTGICVHVFIDNYTFCNCHIRWFDAQALHTDSNVTSNTCKFSGTGLTIHVNERYRRTKGRKEETNKVKQTTRAKQHSTHVHVTPRQATPHLVNSKLIFLCCRVPPSQLHVFSAHTYMEVYPVTFMLRDMWFTCINSHYILYVYIYIYIYTYLLCTLHITKSAKMHSILHVGV